jgi:ribosomal protein L40E
MDKYFGWEIGSNMSRVYLHLTDEQVKKAVLKTYGKAKPEEEKKIITERFCQRCKEKNPLKAEYCLRCGSNLDSGKVVSSLLLMQQEIKKMREANEGMQKRQETQKKLMEELARRLADIIVGQTKREIRRQASGKKSE